MDREKVIKKAERIMCSTVDRDMIDSFCEDVIAMLKEREAVEPYSMNAERTYGICPKCGKIVFRYGNVEENHYCGVCGQEVKWNENS